MTAWLIAFLVHSTLWLLLAWLIVRVRPTMHAQLRETIWYTAIVASFVTPVVQMTIDKGAALWRVPVPEGLVAAHANESNVPPQREHSHHERHEHRTRESSAALRASWIDGLAWIWLALAVILLLRYGGRLAALHQRIEQRDNVTDTNAQVAIAQLSRQGGLRRPPRLTKSAHLGSPIALGIGRRSEICIPTRALSDLDRDLLFAMLGHEVAHHVRRDPFRLIVLNMLQAIFFFQPLLLVALRSLRLAAEEQCDAWVARQREDRLAMAQCLVEVAGWAIPGERRLPVPCMVRRRSQLRARVDRLLDERCEPSASPRTRRVLASVLVVSCAPWLAPAVSPPQEHRHARHSEHDHGSYHAEHHREHHELESEHHHRDRAHRPLSGEALTEQGRDED